MLQKCFNNSQVVLAKKMHIVLHARTDELFLFQAVPLISSHVTMESVSLKATDVIVMMIVEITAMKMDVVCCYEECSKLCMYRLKVC